MGFYTEVAACGKEVTGTSRAYVARAARAHARTCAQCKKAATK